METTESPSPVWQAAKRGALLGFYVTVALYLVVIPITIYAAISSRSARDELLAAGVLRTLGGALAGFCLATLYLATAGAVIMGIIGYVRYRRRPPALPK